MLARAAPLCRQAGAASCSWTGPARSWPSQSWDSGRAGPRRSTSTWLQVGTDGTAVSELRWREAPEKRCWGRPVLQAGVH